MSGPIVRVGTTPEYAAAWTKIFGDSSTGKGAKKKSPKKQVAKKAAKKKGKKQAG
jgi:hypothetical protein